MESFDNMTLIAGSRRPIFLPAFSDNSSPSSHTPTPPSALSFATSFVSSTRSRRKPAHAFKSPSADDSGPGEWEAGHKSSPTRTGSASGKHASPHPYERRRGSTSTETSGSSAHKFTPSVKSAIQRHAPLLPLYHPLGPLAQSLPKLDPGLFGLPSSLSIDDGEDQADGEAELRSGSRSRRVGPKGREDDAQSNGTPHGVDKPAQDAARERNPSPRKRRGGGGAKRKRKEADDADGVFPPPAKRTRNPRGAAANSSLPAAPSPLVGPAVVAFDLAEEVPENNGGAHADAEEAEEAQEVQQTPKRGARTRKPRARPAKRRNSSGSASAASSVSVSIAAATRAAAPSRPDLPMEGDRLNEPEPEPEPQPESEPEPGLGAGERQPQATVTNGVDAHEEASSGRPSGIPTSTRSPIEKLAPLVETLQQASAAGDSAAATSPRSRDEDVSMDHGVTHTPGPRVMSTVSAPPAASAPPRPPPAPPAQMQKVPPPRAPPQKEEREEGELSD